MSIADRLQPLEQCGLTNPLPNMYMLPGMKSPLLSSRHSLVNAIYKAQMVTQIVPGQAIASLMAKKTRYSVEQLAIPLQGITDETEDNLSAEDRGFLTELASAIIEIATGYFQQIDEIEEILDHALGAMILRAQQTEKPNEIEAIFKDFPYELPMTNEDGQTAVFLFERTQILWGPRGGVFNVPVGTLFHYSNPAMGEALLYLPYRTLKEDDPAKKLARAIVAFRNAQIAGLTIDYFDSQIDEVIEAFAEKGIDIRRSEEPANSETAKPESSAESSSDVNDDAVGS